MFIKVREVINSILIKNIKIIYRKIILKVKIIEIIIIEKEINLIIKYRNILKTKYKLVKILRIVSRIDKLILMRIIMGDNKFIN